MDRAQRQGSEAPLVMEGADASIHGRAMRWTHASNQECLMSLAHRPFQQLVWV